MKVTFARIGHIGEMKRTLAIAANAILYCCSYEHKETSEDALCLVSKEVRRLGYDS